MPDGASPPDKPAAKPGTWALDKDVPLTNGMKLSDVIQKNPNISAVRFLEIVSQPGQPSKFNEILNMGRSLLQERLGPQGP